MSQDGTRTVFDPADGMPGDRVRALGKLGVITDYAESWPNLRKVRPDSATGARAWLDGEWLALGQFVLLDAPSTSSTTGRP